MLEEAHRLLRETVEDDMRATLNRMRRRLAPQKPLTLEQLKAMADAFYIRQQIKAQDAAQMLFMINMLQPPKISKQIDKEELKDLFTKPFKDMMSQEAARVADTGWEETFQAIGQLLKNCIPNTGPSNDFL